LLWALADPKIGEREVPAAMIEVDADLAKDRPGLLLITDKGVRGKKFEASPRSEHGITLLRPCRKKDILRAGGRADAEEGSPAHRIDQRHPERAARRGWTGDVNGRTVTTIFLGTEPR
jgi:hypothetical protein